MLHLIALGADLRERGIGLKVLEQGIDTAPPRAAPCSGCCRPWPSSSASTDRLAASAPPRPGIATPTADVSDSTVLSGTVLAGRPRDCHVQVGDGIERRGARTTGDDAVDSIHRRASLAGSVYGVALTAAPPVACRAHAGRDHLGPHYKSRLWHHPHFYPTEMLGRVKAWRV